MDFETLKPLFLVLFGIILSSFEPVWKLLQFLGFSMQFLAISIFDKKNFLDIFQQFENFRIFLKGSFENLQNLLLKTSNFLG